MIHKYQFGAPVYVPDLETLKATRRLIGRGTRKVAEYGLKGLGWLGEALNNVVTAGASSDFGQTSPFTFSTGQERRNILKGREQVRLQAKLKIDQGMTWASPLNYGAALWNGHGLNAEKGAEEISTWDPRWQLLGRVGEMFTVAKGKPTVKAAIRTGDRVLAKAGNRRAKLRVISRELSKNITEATKNGRIEVTNAYFAAPDKWYRVSERPEKIGIELNGKNVTTSDDPGINGTINGWRESMLSLTGRVVPGKGSNEGYFIFQPRKISLSKHGAAHGNTSQAAKGQIWLGTFAFSDRFPIGIIEGQAPMKVFRGMNEVGRDSRTNFVLQDWDKIPLGARIGFHTGEMPMSNLGWFLKTKNGTFTYEPIISEKRIEIKPSTKLKRILSEKTYPWYRGKQYSINEVVNPDGTVNPRQAMKILHEVSEQFPGSYKMEHRLENPEWHQNDPTTYYHTKKVAQSAWHIDPPKGFTKQDLMIAALGHDFGKIVAGDGHAQIGADLARLVFPDLTDALYTAIAQHMGSPKTLLGKATKMADMRNGIVVRNINGKTRILLPTHTDTKPREIVMDPQGNNKYYVHMRFWDDVENHIPGNISNVEKSNLFQTLYETLPNGAEILFPKSGPGNYATRGTVAGLMRLSRDPRFTPGTPSTLWYLDGNNIKTYRGTSFIKGASNDYGYKAGGKINI